jgi:hypothetical protein
MDLWTAIVIIVLIGSVSGVIKSRNDRKHYEEDESRQQKAADEQIKALEKRIANIESIIFELEKDRSFSQLERESNKES